MTSPQDEVVTDQDTGQHLIEHEEREESHHGSETSGSGTQENKEKDQMERFYWHSLCLCLIPPLVAAYFVVIWLKYLSRDSNPVRYGSTQEIWVYYSWIVICVFGIGWSKYGLAGVELAMLQRRQFGAPDTATLVMHSGNSWSGPDGWLRLLNRLLRGTPVHVHLPWYVLAFFSALPYVAFPISGLCMELSDGYIFSAASPKTIGYNSTLFNNRQYLQTVERGKRRWESGSSGQLPGIGVLYTPDYHSRDQLDGLDRTPNRFPENESVPEVFVAPQAEVPIGGRVWGLRVGYNCSVVDHISQFTLVTDKRRVSKHAEMTEQSYDSVILSTKSKGSVYVYNSSLIDPKQSSNLFAYLEMGISNVTEALFYDGTEPNTFDPRDISKADILELIIWQVRHESSYEEQLPPDLTYNDTINEPVLGAAQPIIHHPNGTIQTNSSFFDPEYGPDGLEGYANTGVYPVKSVAPPIGVRCTRFSALGYANLDARASTFHNFTIGAYPHFDLSREESLVQRFGFAANNILLRQYFNIYESISSPTPTTHSNSVVYRRFLQARELQKSVMLAHAIDALQLMYDGVDSFEHATINPDLSSSRPGKVLTSGVVPALCPVVLFLVWATGCLLLGLRYGFVRRWSDTLDGYYLLSVGVNDWANTDARVRG
ncbi:uncharacterized protein LDX57_006026 [Aspergillus melleus]|uniref:uncharacterized protein n=1 Tax=Aspergillus melleus TaxID=138277 RepID=UPI001E8DDC69|nr:uncharacterized protein LDX57_006026 [Aspergillus melleus]KAH8428325.1 hypothetical protein LDX57_006026 [Aspergillus melleus]